MKKIMLLAVLTVFGLNVNAQTAKKSTKKVAPKATATKVVETPKPETPAVEGAGMVFENETIDYGTIARNAEGKREFVFVNNGNKPLKITNTQGSCGCTVPTKPEKDVMPGERAVIGVKYDTSRVGQFTKTVTVTSNATGQESKILTIKGNVLPDTPAEGTPAPTKS